MRFRFFCFVVACVFMISACGSDKSTGPDRTAPGAIGDLVVSSVTDTSATLTWTASGDDGDNGTATAYDIRFSASTITGGSWETDTQVEGEPSPQIAGSQETLEVTVLASLPGWGGPALAAAAYYFAVRAVDDSDNWSALSNVASTDLADGIPPGSVDDLRVSVIAETSITVEWTAPGDDGFVGRATAYEVRYSTIAITEESWASSAVALNPPQPRLVYATESMEIDGLSAGTTYFLAMKASDETGNWSELSNVISATPFADQVVNIPDASLEAGLRSVLGIATGDIKTSDMATLTSLDFRGAGISDITGLEACFNLQMLQLDDNTISALAPLAKITTLEDLRLSDNAVVDVSPLANLTSLTFLDLEQNQIADTLTLTNLTSLKTLRLWKNSITNADGISGMVELRFLDLTDNLIPSLPSMGGLTQLLTLWISTNQLTDVSPLVDLTALVDLSMGHNSITDLSPVSALTRLQRLNFPDTQVSDLQPLSGLINLDRIFAHNNSISDVSPLSGMTHMTRLWLYNNQITDIAPLAGLIAMEQLSFFANDVGDLSPLAGMTQMTRLFIYDNPFSDISVLSNMTNLQEAFIGWSDVTDLTPLKDLTGIWKLVLDRAPVSDLSPLAGLTGIRELFCWDTQVNDISVVGTMIGLTKLFLSDTPVVDLGPAVNNLDFAGGDQLWVESCPSLSTESVDTHIPALEARGVTVFQ